MNQKLIIDAMNLLQPKECQATTQIYRSIQNKLLGLEKRENSKKTRDKQFNLKSTPTKEATSPLRYPLRVGYHEDPLASPNPHKEDWC